MFRSKIMMDILRVITWVGPKSKDNCPFKRKAEGDLRQGRGDIDTEQAW